MGVVKYIFYTCQKDSGWVGEHFVIGEGGSQNICVKHCEIFASSSPHAIITEHALNMNLYMGTLLLASLQRPSNLNINILYVC